MEIELTPAEWALVLQTIAHRRLQTGSPRLKAELEALERRIDKQLEILP